MTLDVSSTYENSQVGESVHQFLSTEMREDARRQVDLGEHGRVRERRLTFDLSGLPQASPLEGRVRRRAIECNGKAGQLREIATTADVPQCSHGRTHRLPMPA